MPMIPPALRRTQAAATPTTSSPAASSSTTATLDSQSLCALPRIRVSASTLNSIVTPVKKITSETDVEAWKASAAYSIYTLFLQRVCEACVGKPTRLPTRSTDAPVTPVDKLVSLLWELDSWTQEIEPHEKPQRFGNLAFRDWGARLEERIDSLLSDLLPSRLHAFAVELRVYLLDSFGSFTRIDYGSGHELAFFAWLCFLYRLGFFDASEEQEQDETLADIQVEERIGLDIFPLYLMVVWKLQDRYGLEPAGSHGVWGLDDFQFLPYVIGAAQLRRQSGLRPNQVIGASSHASILQTQLATRTDPASLISTTLVLPASSRVGTQVEVPLPNLYLSSLLRIHVLKRGPFHEHSPLLNDIASSVPNWLKVYFGMLKMYAAECLAKKVVVQHFAFGGVGWVWTHQAHSELPRLATPSAPVAAHRHLPLGGIQGNMTSMGVPTPRITRPPATPDSFDHPLRLPPRSTPSRPSTTPSVPPLAASTRPAPKPE